MKGIILAGGSGTRLYPITKGISKQLIPIYDKPLIYYPLTTLIEAGIREILIITTEHDLESYQRLLGDGSQLGCRFSYETQDKPRGLAHAFIVGEEFIGDDHVALILGDNLFYGGGFSKKLRALTEPDGGVIFAAHVHDPKRYGVVDFDENMKVVSIEEKPETPKSNYAIPGLYIFDNKVIEHAKQVQPSQRGELEITDIHNAYLSADALKVGVLDRSTVWLDTGTFDSMLAAAEYVRVIEQRQGIKLGCIEEAAFRSGFINKSQLNELAELLLKSGYGEYLKSLE